MEDNPASVASAKQKLITIIMSVLTCLRTLEMYKPFPHATEDTDACVKGRTVT